MKIFSNYSKDWFSEDGVEMIFKHTLITNTLQDQALNWYKSQHWIINASNDFNHKPLSRQSYGLNLDIYYHFACSSSLTGVTALWSLSKTHLS